MRKPPETAASCISAISQIRAARLFVMAVTVSLAETAYLSITRGQSVTSKDDRG
jgi:hypothetical protein